MESDHSKWVRRLRTFVSALRGRGPGCSAGEATGPQRGVSHCYICETAERPAVIIFAREPNDSLGALAQRIDKALIDHKKADLRGWIEDPEGADSYPIVTFTWLLFYKRHDEKKAAVLRQLVEYCATKGQTIADSMGYIPLPTNVVQKVKTATGEIK